MPSARHLAVSVLREWSNGKAYATELIDQAARQADLAPRDTALLQTLVYAVLRNLSLLDHWCGHLSGGRDLDPASRMLLRLGLAQLLILDMPEHAVVNETVNLATRARGFINANLRSAIRSRDELKAQIETLEPAVRWSHPKGMVERLIKFLPNDKLEAFLNWNQQPAPVYVRINRLHPDAEATLKSLPGIKPHGEDFFLCEQTPREALADGKCYAQDPSTLLAPALLNPQAGEAVLDACAAPGGKTAFMAQLMGNAGTITATDSSPARLKRLASNLARLKITNVNASLCDWTEGGLAGNPKFDAILLDVPCSNTGVMRRRIDVRWRLKDQDYKTLPASQLAITKAVLKALKPGGRLVYSTCSVLPEENEGVIQNLIRAHPDVRLVEERRNVPPNNDMDGAYAALLTRG
ncbi:MAG: methyltransferase domain-containing protein [Verrucomicrobiaceae bacterium]|nr:methyltransferase domain-containing protein [Verrucomicrobiaceae bacterium]